MATRKVQPKTRALMDQILAVLQDADGFPMSTGEIARQLGGHLVGWRTPASPKRLRPACWTEDIVDSGGYDRYWCYQCQNSHQLPVWRPYEAQDIRSMLNQLTRTGQVQKLEFDGVHRLHWRV